MPFSGRYPEHDICENFNAIDVRELQRKTGCDRDCVSLRSHCCPVDGGCDFKVTLQDKGF
jgi:hypothetical protein